MANGRTKLIAIGGGEVAGSPEILDEIVADVLKRDDGRMVVMTVATNEPQSAGDKYNRLFRSRGIKHVLTIDVSTREDAFDEASLQKIKDADALFFTGGDQLNITSLMGGTPLHDLLTERAKKGLTIAGTSAGAAMMSNSMIISGKSDHTPQVGAVEIAPGMNLIPETLIDTHFSQRGRHGRLLTAMAHYPQDIGLGIDERTALVARDHEFRVIGEGAVTVMDGANMKHNDLPYHGRDEPVGMFSVCIHVLPRGYRFDLKTRTPQAPQMHKLAGVDSDV